MRTAVIMALLLLTTLAQATVYKWVDKDGKVHYSDEPVENATAVEFKSNTQNNVALPAKPVIEGNPEPEPQAQPSYRINISSPSEEETIRDNNGEITIMATISPKLAPGHVLVLMMDGKVKGAPQNSPIFALSGIDRGEHTFEIKAVAQSGKQLASSEKRTIYLHRATIKATPRATPFGG
ncbi:MULTISPECIES: DUF4124 domain-containing protein [Shewanella]|uniref:DUF4124 domain-containing protein n=1 Tax=Shewanella TaxID=22 RepID=UPI00048B36EF|nr:MULTISPECIES: DUF4124 domain-containing protein [Shewanella]QLE87321.1 DUF4124 domain-containing protein [Shewanella sp. Scap07]